MKYRCCNFCFPKRSWKMGSVFLRIWLSTIFSFFYQLEGLQTGTLYTKSKTQEVLRYIVTKSWTSIHLTKWIARHGRNWLPVLLLNELPLFGNLFCLKWNEVRTEKEINSCYVSDSCEDLDLTWCIIRVFGVQLFDETKAFQGVIFEFMVIILA